MWITTTKSKKFLVKPTAFLIIFTIPSELEKSVNMLFSGIFKHIFRSHGYNKPHMIFNWRKKHMKIRNFEYILEFLDLAVLTHLFLYEISRYFEINNVIFHFRRRGSEYKMVFLWQFFKSSKTVKYQYTN